MCPADVSGVARDTVIFEAFLRLFVETTGHYTEFMNTQQDGELVFQVSTEWDVNIHQTRLNGLVGRVSALSVGRCGFKPQWVIPKT